VSVAVCVTVRNEAPVARALVASLLEQTRAPDELVVVEGGSTDGTQAILRDGLRGVAHATVLDLPGSNIAQGRNAAIACTTAELVAVTDAGITRRSAWLEALVDAVEANPTAAGSFGYVLAAPRTTFEAALGAVALPLAAEIDPALYPPSSGSALYRRSWLERAGGYPDWLDHGEDLWLDRAVWQLGGWFVHGPGADVGVQPRSSAAAFFRQYFNYARGDGQAGMLGLRHLLRYAAYAVGAGLAGRPSGWRLALLVGLAAVYLRRPYRRLPTTLARVAESDRLTAMLLVPWLRGVGDAAKMVGYLAGLSRRFGA
jgi:glycosyltransferase involved in cell wall biosynthesis